jgi:hypothetical protein
MKIRAYSAGKSAALPGPNGEAIWPAQGIGAEIPQKVPGTFLGIEELKRIARSGAKCRMRPKKEKTFTLIPGITTQYTALRQN